MPGITSADLAGVHVRMSDIRIRSSWIGIERLDAEPVGGFMRVDLIQSQVDPKRSQMDPVQFDRIGRDRDSSLTTIKLDHAELLLGGNELFKDLTKARGRGDRFTQLPAGCFQCVD